ncbi:amidohydrolase [Pigmentiphaga aceris]|uniref:Amidohydrolase n=1 Tax=Pigmentiphaga aceris TaxID=1940612 RepID=A0A5C0B3S6_9BURK|nr:M20 aminoacylase family protein [Pigmentiphaga aceris]QEI09549.1 amidohydrolase [Pigmentiphaga aceris]
MKQHADEFLAVRHTIHQNPELGFEEFGTSELVARKLASWGYEVERGIGDTGVVGRLQRGNGSRSIGLRADMDALPILESTGLPYASKKPGVMHACGHDGHTTMLLGAAKYLAEAGDFSGTVNLIFQPAEEGRGGALKMLEHGLFDKYPCDAIFGMHNLPGYPQGKLMFRDGATMASADKVVITLTGVGGHGAMPHKSVDPVVAAASLVMALQTIVSRNVDPQHMAIVTVGMLHAGQANNIIPDKAVMELTVRTLDRDVRKQVEKRIRAITAAQAESFGVEAHIHYDYAFAVLVNTPEETALARTLGRELMGEQGIDANFVAQTASEDFSYMLEQRPGNYCYIGNGVGQEHGSCNVHNPGYDFNDANLPIGSAYFALLAERYLAGQVGKPTEAVPA